MLIYSIDSCKLDVSKYNIAINVQFCRKNGEFLDSYGPQIVLGCRTATIWKN